MISFKKPSNSLLQKRQRIDIGDDPAEPAGINQSKVEDGNPKKEQTIEQQKPKENTNKQRHLLSFGGDGEEGPAIIVSRSAAAAGGSKASTAAAKETFQKETSRIEEEAYVARDSVNHYDAKTLADLKAKNVRETQSSMNFIQKLATVPDEFIGNEEEGEEEKKSERQISESDSSDEVDEGQRRKIEHAKAMRKKLSDASGGDMYFQDPQKSNVRLTGIVEPQQSKPSKERQAELNENLQRNLSESDEEVNLWENHLVSKAMQSRHLMTHLIDKGEIPETGTKRLQIKDNAEENIMRNNLFVEFEFNDEDIDNMLQNITDTIKTKEEAQIKREKRLEQINEICQDAEKNIQSYKTELTTVSKNFVTIQELYDFFNEFADMMNEKQHLVKNALLLQSELEEKYREITDEIRYRPLTAWPAVSSTHLNEGLLDIDPAVLTKLAKERIALYYSGKEIFRDVAEDYKSVDAWLAHFKTLASIVANPSELDEFILTTIRVFFQLELIGFDPLSEFPEEYKYSKCKSMDDLEIVKNVNAVYPEKSRNLLLNMKEEIYIERLKQLIQNRYDPLSQSQTDILVSILKQLIEEVYVQQQDKSRNTLEKIKTLLTEITTRFADLIKNFGISHEQVDETVCSLVLKQGVSLARAIASFMDVLPISNIVSLTLKSLFFGRMMPILLRVSMNEQIRTVALIWDSIPSEKRMDPRVKNAWMEIGNWLQSAAHHIKQLNPNPENEELILKVQEMSEFCGLTTHKTPV